MRRKGEREREEGGRKGGRGGGRERGRKREREEERGGGKREISSHIHLRTHTYQCSLMHSYETELEWEARESYSLGIWGMGCPHYHDLVLLLPKSPQAIVESASIQVPKMKTLQQKK